MSKHTPGPWELGYGSTAVPTQVARNSKTFVLQQAKGETGEMAFISSWINDPIDAAEAEANARLIAKSPEMFDALEEAEQVFRTLALEGPSATALELADRYAALLTAIRGTD